MAVGLWLERITGAASAYSFPRARVEPPELPSLIYDESSPIGSRQHAMRSDTSIEYLVKR